MTEWRLYLVACVPRTSPKLVLRIPVHATSQTRAAITGRIVGEITMCRLHQHLYHPKEPFDD
jgi:hypothetical protein